MAKYDFEALKAKVDIVKVISHYLDVSKKGNGYAAICPFHNDSNPSLSISPSKQIFNCFVCHTGGDAFSFVAKYKKIPYINAVKEACDICGVPTDIKIDDKYSASNKYAPVYSALDDLAKYYEFYLTSQNGVDGRKYLESRHLTSDVIKRFRIGFAPLDPELSIKMMREKKNHSIESLLLGGVLTNGSQFKDRYSGKVMFPITDSYGRVVGFSGRRINDSDPSKYVNSPESAVFHKSDLLYNYYESRELAQKTKKIYVVEGFMDVIALTRANIPAVGTMGTALTDNQINLLHNLKAEICLSLDSDNAGQEAMIKISSDLAKRKIKHQIVAVLDDGKDPDEILDKLGEKALVEKMNKLEDPLIHFAKFYKKNNRLATYDQKVNFLETFKQHFLNLEPVIAPNVIKDLEPLLELKGEAIESYLKENKKTEEIPYDDFPGENIDSYGEYLPSENTYIPEDIPPQDDYVPVENSVKIVSNPIKVNPYRTIKQAPRINASTCSSALQGILERSNSQQHKARMNKILIMEAHFINYIRSSRELCFAIEENVKCSSFYYEILNNFLNNADRFYRKNPTYQCIDNSHIEEFRELFHVQSENRNSYDDIIDVLKHFSSENDYERKPVDELKRSINNYNKFMEQVNKLTKK